MEHNGAEIVVKCLQEEKVKHVFGYPGGAVLYIYDEIFKQKEFQHILVRHEQAAVHAADAYARSSENVGVCLVTSGPGVTNAVTGIATAYMDSIPMVIISGQVPTHAIGLDAFQECDTVGITRPCVKHNFLVKDVKDLALTIKKAFYIASSGRPGPVLVDIPKDITREKCKFQYPKKINLRSYCPTVVGHSGQIRKAAQLIKKRKYRDAFEELTALIDIYPDVARLYTLRAKCASKQGGHKVCLRDAKKATELDATETQAYCKFRHKVLPL